MCVRVTLNDDPHAHSGEGGGVGDCVRYTSRDAAQRDTPKAHDACRVACIQYEGLET